MLDAPSPPWLITGVRRRRTTKSMGADSCVVYYGVRYQVTDETELEQLEARTHPLMEAAKRVGLQHYWGNFSTDGGDYHLLLVGREIGIFGIEGLGERELADAEFRQ